MSEAVTIISVSASALVGVGGVAAAAWGGSRERRWQTREERTIDLRTALDDASEQLTAFQVAVDTAHDEATCQPLSAERRRGLLVMQQQLVVAAKRIGVRCGPKADQYVAFVNSFKELSGLTTILEEVETTMDAEQHNAYGVGWSKGLDAEQAYLRATAKALSWDDGPLPWWRKTSLGTGESLDLRPD